MSALVRVAVRLFAVCVIAVGACAVPVEDARFQERQAGLLQASLDRMSVSAGPRHRIYYVGVALYPESWSENDVVEFGQLLQAKSSSYAVVPIILSNSVTALPERFPVVDQQAVARATSAVAQHAGPGDLTVILISSHGSRGSLARKIGLYPEAPVQIDELHGWLAPLGDRPTIIIVSACFSGSLIPGLKAENRIIITAARADRASFGCRAGATHTVFGEALLDAFARPDRSIEAIVADLRTDVMDREQRSHYAPASQPQVFVGHGMAQAYQQSLLP